MKHVLTTFILVIYFTSVYSQDSLGFKKSYNFAELNESKEGMLKKQVASWIDQQTNLTDIIYDDNNRYTASGSLEYINPIEYKESETFSRTYIRQTNGKIVYKIFVVIEANKIELRITDIEHKPASGADGICYGPITGSDEAPANLSADYGSGYCNDVWNDMKTKVNEQLEKVINSFSYEMLKLNKIIIFY